MIFSGTFYIPILITTEVVVPVVEAEITALIVQSNNNLLTEKLNLIRIALSHSQQYTC